MNKMIIKDVYKIKDGVERIERKPCHPRKLALTSKYIAPYWFEAFHNVFNYDKLRGLQSIHKLTDDRRIKAGYELYRNGHIKEIVVTKHNGGDVRATVLSENNKDEYTVLIKDFLPDKLPQYTYQREEFIAKLFVGCSCNDHHMCHYKDNSSMLCKHICAVIWFLMARFDMPKIFYSIEDKMLGVKKSNTEEIETNIMALPLVRFTQYINILQLNNFRGMTPALGVSIHRISNEDNTEIGKAQWLTFTDNTDVLKLSNAMVKVYNSMTPQTPKIIEEKIDTIPENTRYITRRWTKKQYECIAVKNHGKWQYYTKTDIKEKRKEDKNGK